MHPDACTHFNPYPCMAVVMYFQESPTAGKVKECFMGEKGLAGLVRTAPLENVFKLATVKKVGSFGCTPSGQGGERDRGMPPLVSFLHRLAGCQC